jgi:hypothetical protein
MPSRTSVWSLAIALLHAGYASAQATNDTPSAGAPAAATPLAEPPATAPKLETTAAAASSWRERYERARRMLVEGDASRAAAEFDALAASAPSAEDERLALELGRVAKESSRKPIRAERPDIRTSDELSILYSTAFLYGLGTSAWIVLLTKPENLAGAILPFAGLTGGAVAGVAIADGYLPFRKGVPHAIAAGLYLGFGEGLWVVGYQNARAARVGSPQWGSEAVSTTLWAGATLGGIAGGLVGASREPTPGRVSFVSSAGTWLALTSGFAAAGLQPDRGLRGETAYLAGGAGLTVGMLSAIAIAPSLAPSVARVRFVDLGAIGGGLLGAGTYAIIAESDANARGGLGSAAIGIAAGVGLTWWLTSDMPNDPPDRPKPNAAVRPLFAPTQDGWMAGISGEL